MANAPPALGASAAVNAIVLLDILLYPKRMVYLYMVLPIPAGLLGVVYIVGDMSGMLGVRPRLHCLTHPACPDFTCMRCSEFLD